MSFSISALQPDLFRIQLIIKVIEHVLSIKTTHENSETTITVNEYLIGNETGCVALSTQQDLKVDNVYHINNAYTQATDGYLRVYAERIEPSDLSIDTVDKENNVSLIFLERKIE